jgi:hypothetical protein
MSKLHSIEINWDTCLKIEVEGSLCPGYPKSLDDPGCPDLIEDFGVYLIAKGKDRLDITGYLNKSDIDDLKEDLIDDINDYDDNDAAYEAMVGK